MTIGDGHRGKGGAARRGGLAEKVQRSKRAAAIAMEIRDPEAADIAQRVYGVATLLKKADQPSPVPLAIEAPLVAAFELAAIGIIRRDKLPETEEYVNLVASYLIAATRYEIQEINPDTLAAWRERQEAGESPV